MATADDRDGDEDEKAEAEGTALERAKAAKIKDKDASETARAARAAEHATGHEDEDEEEDEDEDEEIKPAPKPVAKPATKRAGAKGPGAARGKAGATQGGGGGSLGKSVMLFFVIVIGLGAGFAILGRETPVDNRPKWKVGDTADVEITLVKSDRQDLACAAAEEIGGKHCAFEAMNKPWSKGAPTTDDKQILKPYTTVDRVQFTAAGLWADPSMQPDKLPTTRFTVKCKYKVEGKLPNVGVRWEQTGQWFPNTDWYAGSVTDCKVSS